ncbi:hypothetical protein MKX03_026811 [Papaver bracteatum]|nr:hypothetical protein MKX03_026811 [Papaver bracteatum]
MAPTRRKKRMREEEHTQYQHSKTKRKLLLGSRVEVRSLEEGFAGSWHCGTVVACSHLCRVVEYDHYYIDDQGLEKLKEKVHVSSLLEGILLPKDLNYRGIIRPIPPPCEHETSCLSYGLCVDAFIDDAWWEGVIFSYEDKLLERLVFFPDFADQQMIKIDKLRVTQDWDEIEECWIVRGNWKFLELIEVFPNAVVSAAQIWHDLRLKEGFKNNIKEWTCNLKSMWVDSVVESVSQNLDISAELAYKVISDKVGIYSVNVEECMTNGVPSGNEEAVTTQIQDLSVFHSNDLNLLSKNVISSRLICEIDDGAQEARGVVMSSGKGFFQSCCTAGEKDDVQGVGAAVECPVKGSSSDDEDPTYNDPSLGCPRGMGLSQKRIHAPTDSGSTGKWVCLPLGTNELPEAKYFPEALEKYLTTDNDVCNHDLQLKARMHLSYMGWRIECRSRRYMCSSSRTDFRYTSPRGGTPLYSIRGACLQAMEFTHRWRVPLSMICRNDQDVHVEPEYCPQAVCDYLNGYESKGWRWKHDKNVKDLREKVKKHLSAEGWTFSLHFLKYNRRDLRYTSPSNSASFKSLVTACIGYVKEVCECMSPSSHDKFLSNTMHPDVLGNILTQNGLLSKCYTEPSGSSQQSKDNPEVGIMQEKRCRDEQRKGQRHSYPHLDEENMVNAKVSELQSDNKYNNTHVPRSIKRARQVVVPSSGHCSPQTILCWLIENDVVLPRAKVRYLSVRDDSAIGLGKINRNGIKCNCCQIVFGLYKFGLHVGSFYTPPSARIYLEDGRSLLDCQKQLQEKCSNIYAQKRDLVLKKNDYICSICHHGGTLLLCDQCPSSFHLNCLGVEDVPDGKWFCPFCQCRICGQQSKLDSDSEEHLAEEKVLCCDQCNHEYHIRCIRKRGLSKLDHNNLNTNWFCSMRCEEIFASLHKLLGESVPVGKDNISWTILKSARDASQPFAPSENEAAMEFQSKVNVALAVMHECFEPIKYMRRDLIEDVLFNKTSELNRLNFWGFYTVLLERDDELISVAAVRIHDEKLAEVPLVCTRVQYRRQGMCRILFDILEKKLRQLGVERVILPAIPQVLGTWTTSFGFSKMTNSERLEFLHYTFLDFQDTRMCQKILRMSSPTSAKPTAEVPKEVARESNANVQQFASTCTPVDAVATTEESEQPTPQCARLIAEPRGNRPKLILKIKRRNENDIESISGAKNVVPDLVVAARPLDVTKTLQDESDRNWQIYEPCIAKKCLLDGKPRDYQCTQETTLQVQVDSEQNPKNTELGDSENSALAVYNENQQEKRGSCVKFYTRREVLGAYVNTLPALAVYNENQQEKRVSCVKFYTRRKVLGALVNTLPAAEKSEQSPHVEETHSCQDVFEEDRMDISNSHELGKQKIRQKISRLKD